MQLDINLLQSIPLFKGIKTEEFAALFACVGARKDTYQKGAFIFFNGDIISSIGIMLAGHALIIKEDVFGNRAVLNELEKRDVFGEAFACGGSYALTISVQATENCDILFLPFERIMNVCSSSCGFHNALIKNMVEMIAQKNINLMRKLEVTTKHSLREKMLAYLSQLAQEQGKTMVQSPLGRVDLAGLLGVDRSALTRELNRMRDAGLIDFEKNTYTLLDVEI